MEATGFRLYFEVGGAIVVFVRVDVMEEREDGLAMDSSWDRWCSGEPEELATLALPSVLDAVIVSAGVSVRTEIFSSTDTPPAEDSRLASFFGEYTAFFNVGKGSPPSCGLCDPGSEAMLSGARELLEYLWDMAGRGLGVFVCEGKSEKDAEGEKDACWYGETSFSMEGDAGL
jgi:hypothetical protein